MAKKSGNADRKDPKSNKSLAIRLVLKKMPNAKFAEVAEAVKAEYGHEIGSSMFYMLKTKNNIKSDKKAGRRGKSGAAPMNSAASWVEAIKFAKQLLKAAGSVENATALLKAVNQ